MSTNNPALALRNQLYNVHSPQDCYGEHCVFHNPSDHHMITWHANWNPILKIVVRVCPHRIEHPDPDTPLPYQNHGHGWTCGCCKSPDRLTEDDFWKELYS